MLTPAFCEQGYKQSTGHEVPPPPSAVKRAVLYVSDLAERTGMTLVVRAWLRCDMRLRAHFVLLRRSRWSSASCRAECIVG